MDPQLGRSNPGTNPGDKAKSPLWLGIRERVFPHASFPSCDGSVKVKLRVTTPTKPIHNFTPMTFSLLTFACASVLYSTLVLFERVASL
jgi:hypothetical protein